MLGKNIDIFLISDTKLNVPLVQFKIEGFTTPYRYDRNDKGGDLLLYVREVIPSRSLQCKSQCNIDRLSVEIQQKNCYEFRMILTLLLTSIFLLYVIK